MLLGEINKDDIFSPDFDLAPFHELVRVMFCFFLFLMPMVLANLTVGGVFYIAAIWNIDTMNILLRISQNRTCKKKTTNNLVSKFQDE